MSSEEEIRENMRAKLNEHMDELTDPKYRATVVKKWEVKHEVNGKTVFSFVESTMDEVEAMFPEYKYYGTPKGLLSDFDEWLN